MAFSLPLAAQAFDPNAGADATKAAPTHTVLPSTAPLVKSTSNTRVTTKPTTVATAAPAESSIYTTGRSVPASVYMAADPSVEALAAPTVGGGNASATAQAAPVTTVTAAPQPVIASAPAPAFPPVDAATQAKAQAIKSAEDATTLSAAAPVATPSKTFIAPAPLTRVVVENPRAAMPAAAPTTFTAMPAATMAPTVTAQAPLAPIPMPPVAEVAQAPIAPLSNASKDILSKVPSKLDTQTPATGKFSVSRMSPEVQTFPDKAKTESYDSVGLSIKVQRPGLDANFELNRAYTALMGGDTSQAIEVYKNILTTEPANQDALFGAATTYHRIGSLDLARSYYARLLNANPNHRAGLNNFMALISEEAPEEALAELERLEQRNKDYGAIPAQQAIILKKLGFMDRAREKMVRAIELAPDNLTYKYNLAVMLDTIGNRTDAGALYRLLIAASLRGEPIPAPVETLQKRLNYISNLSVPRATGG
jgi:Tfp pilus assembly protein PilF